MVMSCVHYKPIVPLSCSVCKFCVVHNCGTEIKNHRIVTKNLSITLISVSVSKRCR